MPSHFSGQLRVSEIPHQLLMRGAPAALPLSFLKAWSSASIPLLKGKLSGNSTFQQLYPELGPVRAAVHTGLEALAVTLSHSLLPEATWVLEVEWVQSPVSARESAVSLWIRDRPQLGEEKRKEEKVQGSDQITKLLSLCLPRRRVSHNKGAFHLVKVKTLRVEMGVRRLWVWKEWESPKGKEGTAVWMLLRKRPCTAERVPVFG